MYEISSKLYLEIADRLMAEIGSKEYFSGTILCTHGDIECKLLCSLIIERERTAAPDQNYPTIVDIVPVWWEFSTVEGSVELLNDFSFSELKALILE